MANHENYLTLIACDFHNNMANDGGALSVWDHADATNTVFDCTFAWNWADSYGGAILDLDDDLMVTDCLFFANSAGVGGGIFADGSDTTLTDCTFTSNHVFSDGGGMRSAGGSATLVRCTFNQNIADSGGGMDAGLYLTLVDCTFDANVAFSNGGGMVDGSPSVHQDCVFTRNFAGDNGGAVASYNGEHDWVKCVFAENTATDGGGIHSWEADAKAVNCRFVGNRAFTYGGAMCTVYSELSGVNCTFSGNLSHHGRSLGCDSIDQNYPSSVWMANCICWNGGDEIWNNDESSIVVSYTCMTDGFEGEGNIDLDPLFVDPVGPDGYPGTEDDDLRLSPGSPCIDAADNSAVPEDIMVDLDGNPRFVDDPDTEDTGFGEPPIVDMGAYEYQPESPECPADFDEDGDVDTADLLFLLAAWGTPDGDVDGDGDTDTADLLALLGAWGECPE